MTLPPDFTSRTRALMGEQLFKTFLEALEEDAPVSIRINPFKIGQRRGTAHLPENNPVPGASPVPWCAEGWYLEQRPLFTFDPLLHAGCYYVQEASSMMVSHVVRQLVHEPVMALDLCAAPGGKSTAVRAALPAGSLLISNEPIRQRAQILAENAQKFGHPDMMVTNNYPKDYQKADICFDIIVADVPCSGEGMFRKDEGAVAEWSVQHVEQCWRLQCSIVEDIWPVLRPGGLLIYSTCTFNTEENEDNVTWIARELGADVLHIPTAPDWHIIPALKGSHSAMRFIPGRTKGEGLFMAVLRKEGESESAWTRMLKNGQGGSKKTRKNKPKAQKKQTNKIDLTQWLQGEYALREQHGSYLAVPQGWLSVYDRAADTLHLLHAGIVAGTAKGNDVVPHQSLALSTKLLAEAFPRVPVDYLTAISYLRREAVSLPTGAPRGIVLLEYEGHALGFAKNIGPRANNLYPAEWKIKSSHVPEVPVRVLT